MSGIQDFMEGIESPALRAVAEHWFEARGTMVMPRWSDISTSVLAPHFKLLWGFQYNPRTKEFIGGLTGERLKEWLGAGFSGARMLDLHSPTTFREAQQLLIRIVTTPLAVRSSGRLFTVGDRTVTGERIAFPLAADGRTGDAILGASVYDSPVLSGPVKMIYENLEWCAL
jgi:hypothetical protein